MIAEHLAQRLMEKMRRRMVLADVAAPGVIDFERERSAGGQRAFLDGAGMHEDVAGMLLRVGDAKAHAVAAHEAGIADLAAGFAVERRLVEHDRAAFALS